MGLFTLLHLIGGRKLNLREFRLKHGMSQIGMAQKIGVHLNTYVLWERGVSIPSSELQTKLDRAIDEIKKGR